MLCKYGFLKVCPQYVGIIAIIRNTHSILLHFLRYIRRFLPTEQNVYEILYNTLNAKIKMTSISCNIDLVPKRIGFGYLGIIIVQDKDIYPQLFFKPSTKKAYTSILIDNFSDRNTISAKSIGYQIQLFTNWFCLH